MTTVTPPVSDTPQPIKTRRLRRSGASDNDTVPKGSTDCSTGNETRTSDMTTPLRDSSPEPTHYITLQSHEAQKLWTGRAPTGSNTYRILGCVDFASYVRQIVAIAREHNDPYAIFQLVKIERALDELTRTLVDRLKTLDELLKEDEHTGMEFNAPSLKSFTPQRYPVLFASSYGYSAARAVGRFDQIIVLSVTARNCALLTDEDWNRSVPHTARRFRALFELARGFRFSGASVEDFASRNSRAQQAIEKYGEPLDDILQGNLTPSLINLSKATGS